MKRKGRKEIRETSERLVMASLVDCAAEETKWLWPERIARGAVTLLAGYPDVGKSFVALDIAARVSRGQAWPDGAASEGAGNVMLLTAEDHFVRKVQPALAIGGADFARILIPYQVYKRRGKKQTYRPINFKRDIGKLARALKGQPDCKLVIVDPLNAFMGSGAGTRGVDVLRVLRNLYDLAARFDVAVVLVAHLKTGVGEAIYRTMGGVGLTTMARGIWVVAKAAPGGRGQVSSPSTSSGWPGGPRASGEPRLFLPVKNNLAAGVLGMAFSLRQHTSEKVPRVEWLEKDVETTADEALAGAPRSKPGPDAAQQLEAAEFLRRALADSPRLVKDIEAEALYAHCIRVGTLRRARKSLKIVAFHKEIPGPWWVCLPVESTEEKNVHKGPAHLAHLDHVARKPEESEVFEGDPRLTSAHVGDEERSRTSTAENEALKENHQ